MSTPKSVIELANKTGAKMVDIKFVDTFGTWQHFSCPIRELTEEIFTEGLGFDGSSIRGWQAINESDMLLIPDTSTAFMDPFSELPTLVMTCEVIDPITRQHYDRDPRWIARMHEPGLAEWLAVAIEPDTLVIDIRAGPGIETLTAGAALARDAVPGHVLAVEPDALRRRLLESNVRSHRLGRIVTLSPELPGVDQIQALLCGKRRLVVLAEAAPEGPRTAPMEPHVKGARERRPRATQTRHRPPRSLSCRIPRA